MNCKIKAKKGIRISFIVKVKNTASDNFFRVSASSVFCYW
jgi:hypothetical protein